MGTVNNLATNRVYVLRNNRLGDPGWKISVFAEPGTVIVETTISAFNSCGFLASCAEIRAEVERLVSYVGYDIGPWQTHSGRPNSISGKAELTRRTVFDK